MGSISSQGTKISHAKWSAKKKSINKRGDFPGGPVVMNLPCNAGDVGLIPGQGTGTCVPLTRESPRATTK